LTAGAFYGRKIKGFFRTPENRHFSLKIGEIPAPVLPVSWQKAAGIGDPPPDACRKAVS